VRNKYAGTCYRCGETVAPGAGHFERNAGRWRTIHAHCVFLQRQEKARAIELYEEGFGK
jgi:hypothetical protein